MELVEPTRLGKVHSLGKLMRLRQLRLYSTLLAAFIAACGDSSSTVTPTAPGAPVAVIMVTPVVTDLVIGNTQVLSAEARDAAGQMVAAAFAWRSSLAIVATVDASGKVTAIGVGTTNLTASSGGVTSNSVSITVTAIVGAPGTVVVDKVSVLMTGIGQSSQLSARKIGAQGAPVAGTVTWTSSAPDKVSVDATGKLSARAIGSAQVLAEVDGIRSTPTLVFVAQPQSGALLVTDAQVVSIGPFLRLAPGESPGVGAEFEVTLQGVTAPATGAMVIAAETAPVAGRVVATRQGNTGLVVTLALVPLYQLFSAYNIALTLDLSAFPLEAAPAQRVKSTRAQPTLSARWNAGRTGKPSALASTAAAVVEKFSTFSCDGSIAPQLTGSALDLTIDNQLKLILDDRPGYSKHALEGSLALVGDAGLKLKAGFKASGRCEAKRLFNLPVFGFFSFIVMPAVRLGFGAELNGEILLVQGELGVQGRVGFSGVTGWECGGVTPACRGLDDISPVNEFKTKSKIPKGNDGMQAKISAQFYVLAGLDLAFGAGLFSGGILEARYGPKQSFDLALEEDQASRRDYASTYDLKLEGVVEPGGALKKAIELAIDDDAVAVNFKAETSTNVSESPKGSLSASKSRVRPGEPVDFVVQLTPATVSYFLLNYNVTGVELWRKREDESKFTQWKSMPFAASNQDRFTYTWTPAEADAGEYEFAAFVNTQLVTPLLEIANNSIVPLEVSCFSAAPMQIGPQAASTCDLPAWSGNVTSVTELVGSPGVSDTRTTTATVTWTWNLATQGYEPLGTLRYDWKTTDFVGFNRTPCQITANGSVPIVADDGFLTMIRDSAYLADSAYSAAGLNKFVSVTTTNNCYFDGVPRTSTSTQAIIWWPVTSGVLSSDGRSMAGTRSEPVISAYNSGMLRWTWAFTRP